LKKNHPLKEDILESSKLFCDYSSSDSDLIESVRKLLNKAENHRLKEEELFTIKSTVAGIEVFLKDYDFKRFDEICAKAKNKGYKESYVDLLLLKGFILSSFSMSGLNRVFRIREKEKIFALLKEIGVKENIYLDLITGKYLLLKEDEKQAALIFEKIKNKIDSADCAARVIVLAILSSIYEREPIKQLTVIQEGLNGNCFYWKFVIQFIDFLTQRGRYVKLVQEGSLFLQKLDENLEASNIGDKLSILDHMIKASFKLNDQDKLHDYIQLFKENLEKLPEDEHGLKKNYIFLQFTHEVLYQTLFEEELLLDLSEKNILNYSSNHYFNMLRSFLIVNPLISRLIQENEFDQAFTYINNVERGKGYSNSTDNLLTFISNFFLSLLIDKSLKWKKYNSKNYEGNQTEVALAYLEEGITNLGELDYSFKIASILQEIILKSRLGRLDEVKETVLDEIKLTEGYDHILALMVSLLYYSGKEELGKYQQTKEQLLQDLDKYKDLSSYTAWKKHLNDIFSFLDIKNKILTTKKVSFLDLEQIKSYTNFLQNQINKQMVR
jgi:hypothetical protein